MVLSRFLVLPLALLFAVSAFACIASPSSGVTPSDPMRIDRGDRQGENTYYFTPTADGTWSAVIENHGLRAIRVVVFEETGLLDRRVLSQRIDFAKYGAYPMGTAVSEPVDVLQGHTYKIVPRNAVGPKGGYALLYDDHATPTPAWPVMIDTAERVYSGVDLGVLGSSFYVLSYEYDHGPVWLYRSLDAGATWSAPIQVFGTDLRYMEPGMCVYRDGDADIIIVASGQGQIKKSSDGGTTWTWLTSLPGYYWRFMGVGTNASWLGVPPDDDIYVVGSTSYDTYGNLAITKSSDGGNSWSQPLTFARTGSCPEIVSDGESLYVVYTSPQPFEGALYIKKSSDWGQTWSEEKLLVAPQTTTKSIRAFSMQYIDSSRAFLTIREQAIGDQVLGGYGAYGFLDFASLTFQETNRLAGPEWSVYEGFAGHLIPDGSVALAWLKFTQVTMSHLMFTYI